MKSCVTFAAKTADHRWVNLPYDVQKVAATTGGWAKYQLSGVGPEEAEAREFRLTADRSAPPGDFQVGEVELEMRNL